ncbi:PTS transporter subunit EIIC [Spiroplasma culicicola]|uniref:PTS system cellobiose-specific IIC component n=1 Tax=Spiroplasma culicicola AES-1 TaxID=1276246 RepID=W6AFV6_9MOLU|nr:PTS transporter subunit EIIC [Spiroplasma culicicola]AHI52594.1 PTS system cellobiose-specific IIC component [Spiroplasma culicicola AES-1]
MDKYFKYPEVNSIHLQLLQEKKQYKANRVEIKETSAILHTKKHKVRSIKPQFQKILKEKQKALKDAFEIEVTGAKYAKNDINQLYANYKLNKEQLNEEYRLKIINRINKAKDEIESVSAAKKQIKEKNRALKIKIKENNQLLKTKWEHYSTQMIEQDKILKEQLVTLKESVHASISKFKKELKDNTKTIVREFIEQNQDIKNVKFSLWKQSNFKLKPFKNEGQAKIYELTLQINQLKIQHRSKVTIQKNRIKDQKLEIRYNKTKVNEVTFKTFVDGATKVSGKISNWKFMVALRNGFFSLMPIIMVGAVFILINNIVLSAASGGLFNWIIMDLDSLEILNTFKTIGANIWNGTYAFYALLLGGAVAYHLAPFYKVNPWSAAVLALASIICMNPTFYTDISVFGNAGMFTGIIISIISTAIYGKAAQNENLKIKMPESVPEGVAKSFNVLIPYAITLTVFGLMSFGIYEIGQFVGEIQIGNETKTFASLNEFIVVLIQKPLVGVVSGFGGMVVIVIIWQLLWSMGIHASGVLSGIVEPIQLSGLIENQEALAQGLDPKFVFTNPFMNNFIHIGGTGGTIMLIFAIMVFSKRSDWRAMAKMTIIPALFCVNEPLLFGLPLVLNPVLFIPFILGPLLAGMFAYFATISGIMNYSSVIVPWTTPPVLGGILTTKDFWAGFVVLINCGILFAVYSPFVVLANSIEKKELLAKYNVNTTQNITIQNKINQN